MRRDYDAAAIDALVPNNDCTIDGSKVTWIVTPENVPTDEQINAKVTELQNEEPYRLLRKERNRRLQATDWRASSDLTLSGDWKAYRQDLRDLPAQQTPKLNSDGELDSTSISWPPEPSS